MAIENPTDEHLLAAFSIVRAGYVALDDSVMSINEKLKELRSLEKSKYKLLSMKAETDILYRN